MLAYLKELWAGILPPLNIPSIGATELLDIMIVTVLLYYILRWVRQTRAWSLFKGIVIVMFIAVLANLFNLVAVKWIVQNAFAMGLIVLVILFQPELRKALEQLGRGAFLATFSKSSEDKNANISTLTVNEIIKAAKAMAAVRTGAIICIVQEVALNDLERTGIPIDALVSSQLLLNIFENKTPLHDGAVIIRENRIKAATCILPLTAEEIGRELGTRHRAAVGVSEISDALVLVVSEETGSISIAMGGKLVRHLNEFQIRDILLKGDGGKPRFILWRNRKNAKNTKNTDNPD